MAQQNNIETVFLDSLNGFEFEDLCARIYQRLGYEVTNIQATGDEGRDLILKHSGTGEVIVVECKHWPGKTVGRPIVQKLHSAMLTYPAKHGAVITTGSFASTAAQYTDKIPERIQLIDLVKLRSLAIQAGIHLATKSDPVPLRAYPVGSEQRIKGHLDQAVLNRIKSAPSTAGDLFDLKARNIDWQGIYAVQYSIYQDFSTAALNYELNVRRATLLIDAQDGEPWSSAVSGFLNSVPAGDITHVSVDTIVPQFTLDMTAVKQRAATLIQHMYASSQTYHGRNNQQYQKECVPSSKNITLHDVRQVYVPVQAIKLTALRNDYNTRIIEGSKDLFYVDDLKLQCRHCGLDTRRTHPTAGSVNVHAQICNTCGAITHPAAWLFPHSFRCACCQKTLCRRCSHWIPKLFVFKRIICDICADALPSGAARQVEKRSTSS